MPGLLPAAATGSRAVTDAAAHSPTERAISPRGWAMLLALGAIWGGAFFFARIAVQEIPPLALVLLRVSLAAIVMHAVLVVTRVSFAAVLPHWLAFLGLSMLNNIIPFSLMFTGQTEIGAGLASVLNATTPFWTMLLANALLPDEKLTRRKAAGIVLGIAGTAVMVGPGLIGGLGGPVWAKFALIGTALSYGFAGIYSRKVVTLRPELMAAGQLTASTAIMLPVVLLTQDLTFFSTASTGAWGAVIGLAVVATALAYFIFFRLLAETGATNTSLVTLIIPVSAILLGAAFLGERLESFELAGMALIGLGLLVIDGRLLPKR
jgi:drug/metabolite transporter (DMT)-like permease